MNDCICTASAWLPQLETALDFYATWNDGESRWTLATILAARSGAWAHDVSPIEWAERLDELEGIQDDERTGRAQYLVPRESASVWLNARGGVC